MADFTGEFEEGFAFAEKLMRLSEDLVVRSAKEDLLKDIFLPLLVAAHPSLCAAVCLIRNGYVPASQSHIRMIFDTAVHVRYLLSDLIKYVPMWNNYKEIERWEQAQDYERAMLTYRNHLKADKAPAHEISEAILQHRYAIEKRKGLQSSYEQAKQLGKEWIKKFEQADKRYNQSSWSLVGLSEMASHPEVKLTFQYNLLYKHFSVQVHPSALSVHRRHDSNILLVGPHSVGLERDLIGVCALHMQLMITLADLMSSTT